MTETVTQILTSSIDKSGQEVNKWQQETMRVSKSDDRRVKGRTRKEKWEAEERKVIPTWTSSPDICGGGRNQSSHWRAQCAQGTATLDYSWSKKVKEIFQEKMDAVGKLRMRGHEESGEWRSRVWQVGHDGAAGAWQVGSSQGDWGLEGWWAQAWVCALSDRQAEEALWLLETKAQEISSNICREELTPRALGCVYSCVSHFNPVPCSICECCPVTTMISCLAKFHTLLSYCKMRNSFPTWD